MCFFHLFSFGPALQYSLEIILKSSRKMLGSAGHDQIQYKPVSTFQKLLCTLYCTVVTRTLFLTEQKVETHKHKLNMELDLKSLFGLHVYSILICSWLRPAICYKRINHNAQIFLTRLSVLSCVRHGCHPLEKFPADR